MDHGKDVSRRKFLAAGSLGAAALTMPQISADAAPAKAPNIIFILADDLGYADVSCYGRPDLKTPHIDSLAADGVRFLQAYANSAVCSATRTALITGRYQYRLRVGLEEPISNANVGVPPEHPTLPSLLKKAGYNTALIGKWHLGPLPDFGPLKSGYDHFYGFRAGAIDYYSHKGSNHKDDLWDDDVLVHEHGYLTEMLGARTVDTVKSLAKQDRPFMLSLHFSAPHWPWEAPGDETESARIANDPSLAHFDGGSQATYRRMIESMDAEIGKVLKALKDSSADRNTIVIFTSDNGGERFSDTWPFVGRKTELLEGGLRIPAIMRWPGHVARGITSDQVAITMDWVPTLLAAAGVNADPSFPSDGINLLPFLIDHTPMQSRKLFWRYKANGQRAARDGNYKILKMGENTFLFDVVADPMERANLKNRHKDIYDRMTAQWTAWNATMLPEVAESYTHAFDAANMADHYGAHGEGHGVDSGDVWPERPTRP